MVITPDQCREHCHFPFRGKASDTEIRERHVCEEKRVRDTTECERSESCKSINGQIIERSYRPIHPSERIQDGDQSGQATQLGGAPGAIAIVVMSRLKFWGTVSIQAI